MNKTMTLLLASTAVSIAFGAMAWSATRSAEADVRPAISQTFDDSGDLPLIFVNDDDDEDDDDDDEGEEDDDDDCDDDDGACAGSQLKPAPAGTAAPPANGLFGNDASPKAITN
ncbi:MAG: hypothetical protein WAK98_08675 [Gemmobacter sp.]